ncbi:MAG: branched-chain amino acid ABC transporter permease, partial [Alphaproteobacteria bacterium]
MTARDTLPILGFLVAAVLISLFVTSNVVLNFLVFTLILAIAAQGWNLLGGSGGQYSFGHAAFFGMGAYVSAILQQRFGVNAYPAAAFGITVAALLGYAIGAMVFRAWLLGSYFAQGTLAFAEVLRIIANATEITGGAAGLLISLNLGAGNLQFANRSSFLILGAVLLALAMLITLALEKSR